MTEPVQLLKKRYIEIDKCYKSCVKNGHDLKEIGELRLKYNYAIQLLNALGFHLPKEHKNHISITHYNATLKHSAVLDIRENCILGLHKNKKHGTSYYAKKYNISKNSILNIVNKKTYSNI